MEYNVDFKEGGKYTLEATVSSAVDNSAFKVFLIEADGNEKSLCTVNVPNTGSLDNYEVKSVKIRNGIKAGKQKIRVVINTGGCNIDKLQFVCTESTGIVMATDDEVTETQWFTPDGRKLSAPQKGINLERVVVNGSVKTRKVIR